MVDTVATVDESGATWVVALMNRHPREEVVCTLQIGDRPIDGTFKATMLTGDSPEAYNDIEHSNRVVPREEQLTFQNGRVSLPMSLSA